ncbi:MAG TPA: hypothetical protein DCR40_00955 [Prolixibacteraceae bacterium]|nr:hypothetical protein [Prolixibacteraceae bacterium]
MKTKIELTPEQRDLLCGHEERQLRAKFDRDLAALKKKYTFFEIEVQSEVKTEKVKLTDEMFLDLWNNKQMQLTDIQLYTGYNKAYLYKVKKRLIAEK